MSAIPAAIPCVLQIQREAVAGPCRSPGVRRLELFGSAAQARFVPGRGDFDVLVELDEPHTGARAPRLIDLAEGLERLPGGPGDPIRPQAVRAPWRAAEGARTRRPVHGAA